MKAQSLARLRRTAVTLGISLLLALSIRQGIAMPLRVATASLAPEIPRGSLALVYRLDASFREGDILAYRHDDEIRLARFLWSENGSLVVERNEGERFGIEAGAAIGRIVMATR